MMALIPSLYVVLRSLGAPPPAAPGGLGILGSLGFHERLLIPVSVNKNTPPGKKMRGKTSLRSTKSGGR